MDIYIKPNKKVSVSERNKVYIEDIADVSAPQNLKKKIEKIKILEIKDSEKKNYLISIIDIINMIDKALPGHTINNVGEKDIVVEYSPHKEKDNTFIKTIKVIFVILVLFTGSSTAIMSFHSDAQMSTIFENYYYIFFNEKIENPILINLPYSIGLAIGIVVFFNHFSGKKLTEDPTPIEVEMSVYETEVVDNIIDTLNSENNKDSNKNGGGSSGSS